MGIIHNAIMSWYKAHGGECSDDKTNFLLSANNFQQTMCIIFVWDMISISWCMKNTDCNVTIYYLSPTFTEVQCSCKCDLLP